VGVKVGVKKGVKVGVKVEVKGLWVVGMITPGLKARAQGSLNGQCSMFNGQKCD
jgi:hypothetical protein